VLERGRQAVGSGPAPFTLRTAGGSTASNGADTPPCGRMGLIAATHDLSKLHKRQIAAIAALEHARRAAPPY
jgi:hypothetical protein